jgi:8-oxo-dGTP pyrophosphatase MutT (NUDIX family)
LANIGILRIDVLRESLQTARPFLELIVTVNSSPRDTDTGGYPVRRPTADPNRFLIPEGQLPAGFAARLEAASEAPVPPRPAATVVLVRETEAGPEALLLRRHNRSGFAADAWVFPGGMVDSGDMDAALPVLCDGPTPDEWAQRLGIREAMEAFGYAAAALREAFEETGILLARRRITEGSPDMEVDNEDALQPFREALLEERTTLREVAVEAGVQLALDQLTYIAHWITPEPEPRRYDTRFFLAAVSPGTQHTLHEPELVEARWMTPRAAVGGFLEGKLKMLPPTVHTLRRLADFNTVDELQTALKELPVPAILPRMRRHPDGVIIEVPVE